MLPMPIPMLTTPRLTLRAFRAADWDAYAAMMADPAVRQFLGGNLLSREEAWAQMETFLGAWLLRGYGMFAVERDGRLIGRVGILHPLDWPEPELAWTMAADAWGQGFATEAAACVRDWIFSRFDWRRIVSFIADDNARSRRVAEKLGAVRDGPMELRGFPVARWLHDRR